jgi:2-aminoadipate transaminase
MAPDAKKKPQLEDFFSDRAKAMKASVIRELLKLTQQPNMISFAGGLPNPETFPIENVKEICIEVLQREGSAALQYETTEGYAKLRNALMERFRKKYGFKIETNNVLITSGSQQGLDLLSKILINAGDIIITTAPTYLGGISSFLGYRGEIEITPLDEFGIQTDVLEEKLKRMHAHDAYSKKPKFVYVVPTFDNPTGTTMPEKRRKHLYDLASEYNFLIVEDDPYSELRFEGEDVMPIKHHDDEGRVIYLGTFSKILVPGFRLAWSIGPEEIIRKMSIAKQSTDLCTNTFTQYIAYNFMARGLLDRCIERSRKLYKEKRDLMLECMKEQFPEGTEWTKPQGGLFTWVTLPHSIDTREMFMRAVQEKVAYVIGSAFYPNGGGHNTMRLNFSYSSDGDIVEGIRRLGNVIRKEIALKEEIAYTYIPKEGLV